MRDIQLIISEIKSHLKIKTDSELAAFLGTTQSNIATWKKRDTINYDLIIEKCPDIDANWLLTGEGSMLKPKKRVTEEYYESEYPYAKVTIEEDYDDEDYDDESSWKEKYIYILEKYNALLEDKLFKK